MPSTAQDVGATLKTVRGVMPVTATGGGAGDGVDQKSAAIDRQGFASAIWAVAASCVIASAQSVALTARLQHSHTPTDGDFVNFGAIESVTIADGADETAFIAGKANLAGARRYIRLVINADPTATGTATVAGFVALGGADVLPPAGFSVFVSA